MHIVGRGERVQRHRPLGPAGGWSLSGHPLICTTAQAPFSMAGQKAAEAIIRHPQGGLRCFQRITVGMPGQVVTDGDGRIVMPAEEEGLALSAFVHLAVEGRMLYGQFSATVLPPVRREYRLIDHLTPGRPGRLFLRCLWGTWRSGPLVLLLAGPGAVATVWKMVRGALREQFRRDPTTKPVHDYGARLSVRELAAEDEFETFVQELDADKYVRLIERRVNEALMDYLEDECGIDVSAYRAQVGMILNQGVIMTGGTVSGQVAANGPGGRISQTQQRGPNINP
jgi:hypothetical protein